MSISEFYDYVNDKNFLNGYFLPMNNPEKYIFLYEEIKKEKQVKYRIDCYQEGNREDIISLFRFTYYITGYTLKVQKGIILTGERHERSLHSADISRHSTAGHPVARIVVSAVT